MDRGYKVSQTWLWLGIEYYTSCGRCKNSAQGGELGGGEGVAKYDLSCPHLTAGAEVYYIETMYAIECRKSHS